MPPSTPPPPPAGWYPDPEGTDLRWWDGKLWTDHVHADPASGNSPDPMRQDSLSVRTGLIARWPWLVAAGIVIAIAALALNQRSGGTHGSSGPEQIANPQTPRDAHSIKPAAVTPSRPERLSTGVAGDVYWVSEALADIHLACGGAREAEVAEAEMGVSGVGNGNVKRATEGAINQSVYGGLVEEEDIDHLIRIYRAHPHARYGTKPMKLVMLDAAADLGNGSCDQPGAERIEREVEFDSVP